MRSGSLILFLAGVLAGLVGTYIGGASRTPPDARAALGAESDLLHQIASVCSSDSAYLLLDSESGRCEFACRGALLASGQAKRVAGAHSLPRRAFRLRAGRTDFGATTGGAFGHLDFGEVVVHLVPSAAGAPPEPAHGAIASLRRIVMRWRSPQPAGILDLEIEMEPEAARFVLNAVGEATLLAIGRFPTSAQPVQ